MVLIDYDFNGKFAMRVEEGLLPLLEEQFSYWRSQKDLERIDLIIRRGELSPGSLIQATKDYSFFDGGFVRYEGNGGIEFRPGMIVIQGRVDESRIESDFIRWCLNQVLMRKGWCLAHASAIVYQGKTILLPAMSGSYKTSLMLEFLSRGADFMGDDRVMVGQEGEMALYPRWIHMLEHNWLFFPELLETAFPDRVEKMANEKRLRKYRKGLAMKGSNPWSRYLKEHYQSSFYCDWMVQPEKIFPSSKVVNRSKVDHAFFLEQCKANPTIVDSSPSRLARLSAASYELEGSGLVHNLNIAAGIDYLDHTHRRNVMERFFRNARCYEVRITRLENRAGVAKIVDELIERLA